MTISNFAFCYSIVKSVFCFNVFLVLGIILQVPNIWKQASKLKKNLENTQFYFVTGLDNLFKKVYLSYHYFFPVQNELVLYSLQHCISDSVIYAVWNRKMWAHAAISWSNVVIKHHLPIHIDVSIVHLTPLLMFVGSEVDCKHTFL